VSIIPPKFEFETFGEKPLIDMLAAVNKFCADLAARKTPRWLSILGTSGAGKTFLAQQVMRWFQQEGRWYQLEGRGGTFTTGYDGRFFDWRKTCGKMLAGEWDIADCIEEQWFAVIDDIGAEHDPSGVLKSKLDQICNSRLRKWTIITSNFLLADVAEKLDVRIASRMQRGGNVVYEVNTTDFNQR
jgi:DNA replication protein DnaC